MLEPDWFPPLASNWASPANDPEAADSGCLRAVETGESVMAAGLCTSTSEPIQGPVVAPQAEVYGQESPKQLSCRVLPSCISGAGLVA